MNVSDYFGSNAVGALVKGEYDGNDNATMYEADDVYECAKCNSLVLSNSRDKHATQHEIDAALLRKLATMSHSHGVIA